jgi:hypothetical protein
VTAVLDQPLTAYRSVHAWADGLRKQWGGDPLAEEPEKLEALQEFCTFVGEDPDAIVQRCFRIRKSDGARVLSNKWRAHYADKIKTFRAQGATHGPRRAAAVLGFLIHNGILIQA